MREGFEVLWRCEMAEDLARRTLPHNEDAEKAVLGAILLNSASYDVASEYVSPSDFYHTGHQRLFENIVAYSEARTLKTLDLVSIIDFLKSLGQLAECGGVAYISSLTDFVSTTASVEVHAKIIHSLALRRRFIQLATEFSIAGYDESQEIIKLLDDSEQRLSALSQGSGNDSSDNSVGEFVTKALVNLRERMSGAPSGNLNTGFTDLDKMTDGGFHPTDFIIIAARPSIGKTAFAISIMQSMIVKPYNYTVAFFSLEMSGVQVSQRLLASLSGIPLKMIRNAAFANQKDRRFNQIIRAASTLYESKLYIIDKPNMKLSEIRTTSRRLKREQGVQAIFIDYIGLIDAEMPATSKKFEQVTEISKALKSLARELEIPVVVLCQVTRDAEGDKNEPQLNNLRDSGAIEQDADMVMFLHRSRKKDEDKFIKDLKGEVSLQPTKVIIAKQRNGETGEFLVGFRPTSASFETPAPYQEGQGPSSSPS